MICNSDLFSSVERMIFRKGSESSTTRTRLDDFSNLHLNQYKPDSDHLVARCIHKGESMGRRAAPIDLPAISLRHIKRPAR